MDIKKLLTESRAVSPVIGVILMVAITVILAAVIGTFVLGLGDQVSDTAPQASFGFQYTNSTSTNDTLTITHESGDAIKAGRLTVASNRDFGSNETADVVYDSSQPFQNFDGIGDASTDITAGTSITLYGNSATDDLGTGTYRVVWTSESGSTSATLQKWSGPRA